MATNGKTDDLNWRDISTEHKDAKLSKARAAMVEANAKARAARQAYEELLEGALYASKMVADSHEILFTHKFGKLRYATRVKGAGKPAAKANPDAVSL